jgi:hypothetical protein
MPQISAGVPTQRRLPTALSSELGVEMLDVQLRMAAHGARHYRAERRMLHI